MLESNIEEYFCRRVTANGGRTYKLKFLGVAGGPDRLVILGGTHLVELKRPDGGELSPRQIQRHAEIREAGGEVYVLATFRDVDLWFTHLGVTVR